MDIADSLERTEKGWMRVWLVGCGWSVLVCAFVCAFVSAFVCSFRGLFACVLSWLG